MKSSMVLLFALTLFLAGCGRAGFAIGALAIRTALLVGLGAASDSHGASGGGGATRDAPLGEMDRDAVLGVLAAVSARASTCGRVDPKGPRGPGTVMLTVTPSGVITGVDAESPFAGSRVGDCVEDEVSASSVKPFRGPRRRFRLHFVVE